MPLTEAGKYAAGQAASGLLSIFNQIYQRGTDKKNIARQNEANMRLADYTYQKDLAMWNTQNLYNSPSEQMKRLKLAGLNPNLVYGNGVTGNTTGNYPRFQTPEINAKQPVMDFLSMYANYQDMQIRQAQINNLNAQRRATESRAVINDINAAYLRNVASFREQLAKSKSYQSIYDYSYKAAKNDPWLKVDINSGDWNTTPSFIASEQNRLKLNAAMLARYNAEVALKNTQNDMNKLNYEYMKWGAPIGANPFSAITGTVRNLGMMARKKIWEK